MVTGAEKSSLAGLAVNLVFASESQETLNAQLAELANIDSLDKAVAVLVEPLYAGPATALALDEGWVSVEIADLAGANVIPLISYEQPVPKTAASTRCRVRSTETVAAAQTVLKKIKNVVLGAPINARPVIARLAAQADAGEIDRLIFVAVAAPNSQRAALAADAWWASGVLMRVLLEELSERSVAMDDASGVAVTLASGVENTSAQLRSSSRWRMHTQRGGVEDDLRLASAIDSVGVVPKLEVGPNGSIVATAW